MAEALTVAARADQRHHLAASIPLLLANEKLEEKDDCIRTRRRYRDCRLDRPRRSRAGRHSLWWASLWWCHLGWRGRDLPVLQYWHFQCNLLLPPNLGQHWEFGNPRIGQLQCCDRAR